MIFQWTPAHRGVYPNHYADVLAKAYLGREVRWPYDGQLQRQGSLIQYAVTLPNGDHSWAAGERQLLQLVQRHLTRFALRNAIAETAHDIGGLIIHLPHELEAAWPWKTAWTAILRLTGKSHDGKGSKFKATGLGAIMRLRAGLLGFGPEDYSGTAVERDAAAPVNLAEVWRASEAGQKHAQDLLSAMRSIEGAVEEAATSPFKSSIVSISLSGGRGHSSSGRHGRRHRQLPRCIRMAARTGDRVRLTA